MENNRNNSGKLFEVPYKSNRYAKYLLDTEYDDILDFLHDGELGGIFLERGIELTTFFGIKGERNGHRYQFDLVGLGTDMVIVVFLQLAIEREYFTEFLKQMEHIRLCLTHNEKLSICGAIAYITDVENVSETAEKLGIYVIKLAGNSAFIINQTDFIPRKF